MSNKEGCLLKGLKRAACALTGMTVAISAMAWGQKGHDVTAYIAEKHLTPAAAATVDSLLDGRSLVYWSNWLDNASHTPEYAYTKTWHYNNVDAGKTYETRKQAPDGDAITALRYSIGILSDQSKNQEEKSLALKMLCHILADIHQPLHMGHATDYGGNTVKLKYFGHDTNLHSIWDNALTESAHKWSYTEWQQQIDRTTPVGEKIIISGNIDDWATQSVKLAEEVYNFFPSGKHVSYNDVAHWTPVIEEQLLKGGLRLAHVLNMLFDPSYNGGGTVTSPAQF